MKAVDAAKAVDTGLMITDKIDVKRMAAPTSGDESGGQQSLGIAPTTVGDPRAPG